MADYHKATNEALKFHMIKRSFPLDVVGIAKSLGIHVVPYKDLIAKAYYILCDVPSEHGFTVVFPKSAEKYIFYNERDPKTVQLFTVAHELAHCVLRHQYQSEDEEKEANCFARNLLCPVWVAQEKGLSTVNDYARVFGVSGAMAEISVKHAYHDAMQSDRDIAVRVVQAFHAREFKKISVSRAMQESFDRAEENWLYFFVG